MNKLLCISILIIFNFVCAPAQTKLSDSVFIADFVKAKDGQYENYMENLQKNWVAARKIAQKEKYIKSFQLFILPKDPTNSWDFVLITEYKNKQQFDDSEKNFAEIFKVHPPVSIKGLKSNDMRDIVLSKPLTTPVWIR